MFLNVPEGKKVTSGVIEDTVKYDPYACLMAFLNEILKVFVVSKTAVELFVIGGLVAVSLGFKEGGRCRWRCS